MAASAAIVVAVFGFLWNRHENKKTRDFQLKQSEESFNREQAAKREDQQVAHAGRVASHIERLLDASKDLDDRFRNIEKEGFLAYRGSARKQAAIQSTLYRLAKFFAAKELFDTKVDPNDNESHLALPRIAELLREIGKTFTYDTLDNSDGTPRFMIWREEQRALADIATRWQDDGTPSLVGYATFVDKLGASCVGCFDALKHDLECADWKASKRMKTISEMLDDLLETLTSPTMSSGGS